MEKWRRLIKKAKLDQALHHITDERYRRLIGTVLKKIPYAIWDNETTTIDIYLADTQPFGPGVYGTTGPTQITESSADTQAWEICVYRKETDPLSDTDIMHVVAHELGHATSNTPCHYGEFLRVLSLSSTEKENEHESNESAANKFAARWGFAPDPSGPWGS